MSSYEGISRADMVLYRKALRQRYPISEAMRQDVIEQAYLLATAGESERVQAAGIKAFLAADKMNQRDEERDEPRRHEHKHEHSLSVDERRDELLEILARLRNRGGTDADRAATEAATTCDIIDVECSGDCTAAEAGKPTGPCTDCLGRAVDEPAASGDTGPRTIEDRG